MPEIKTRSVVEGAAPAAPEPSIDRRKLVKTKSSGRSNVKDGVPGQEVSPGMSVGERKKRLERSHDVSSLPLGNDSGRSSPGDSSGVIFHHTIKGRETKGGIKTLDKAVIASERMKDAFIRTKDRMENLMDDNESNPSSYAQDKVQYMIEDATDGVGRSAVTGIRTAAKKGKEQLRKQREVKQLQKQAEQLRDDAKESGIAGKDAGQTVQDTTHHIKDALRRGEKSAQQSVVHQAEHSVQKKTTGNIKQTVQRDHARTIRYRGRRTGQQTIKTSDQAGRTIKQTAQSTGKKTIKTLETTTKTAERTIKTAEETSRAAIKTSEAAAKAATQAAEKTAEAAAKAAQVAAHVARETARVAAETAKIVAQAIAALLKSAIAAGKALIAAIAAGGWVSVVIILVVVMIGCAFALFGGGTSGNSYQPVSAEVEAYSPYIRQYAEQYGISEYEELIKAVMMQESGGRGTDPMQCSECGYNTTGGYIQDPIISIDWGIHTLADSLALAEVDSPIDMEHIKLALQGYNYGPGYISWAKSRYGGYDIANAIEFSEMMKERYGVSIYGDPQYVSHVLRYYPFGRAFLPTGNQLIVEVAASQIGNIGGEPYWSWYGYEERVPWCACFVSWCAEQCGYLEAGIIPKYAGCDTGVTWFKARNQWVENDVEPSAGMIIFFDWDNKGDSGPQDGSSDHTGIVEKVENGYVFTIEGNTSDGCHERRYPMGHYEIMGYGIPAY